MTQIVVTYNTDRPGNDFDSIPNSSLGKCLDACAKNSGALAFTYNTANRTCYLKGSVSEQVSDGQGISGVKQL